MLSDDDFSEIYCRMLPRRSPLSPRTATMPTLLIRATVSVLVYDGPIRELRRLMPGLQVVRLTGEHSLHATNPVGLARAIADFLALP